MEMEHVYRIVTKAMSLLWSHIETVISQVECLLLEDLEQFLAPSKK
jgi:hypothetical protein